MSEMSFLLIALVNIFIKLINKLKKLTVLDLDEILRRVRKIMDCIFVHNNSWHIY